MLLNKEADRTLSHSLLKLLIKTSSAQDSNMMIKHNNTISYGRVLFWGIFLNNVHIRISESENKTVVQFNYGTERTCHDCLF